MQREPLQPRILLIEDNDIDGELVSRMVARYPLDISIVRARNGIEALEVLNCPDEKGLVHPYIVLLDINMPLMSGIELLEHMANNGPKITVPIYILSTSDSEIDRKKFSRYDIAEYFVKPLTKDILTRILESLDTH